MHNCGSVCHRWLAIPPPTILPEEGNTREERVADSDTMMATNTRIKSGGSRMAQIKANRSRPSA